jgi:Fe(II)/alpha-ketoglutarate-dependent arginine beta-hydroxylase
VFLTDARVLAGELPRAVRRAVLAETQNETAHAVLISGNPIDEDALPPTPGHWRDANTSATMEHSFVLLLYSALLGDAIGWRSQQDGRIITDVLPIAGYENSLVSASSQRELGWHTEDAFSPYRGDYVGLYCLRNPRAISTTVSYVDLSQVPEHIGRVLLASRFHTLPDTSHTVAAGGHADELRRDPPSVPLLGGTAEAPVLCIDSDFTVAVDGDKDAAHALKWLTCHLNDNIYDVVLRAGDIVILDNRKVVHGRRAFRPRYNGEDRWLKRTNFVIDLRRTRSGRASAESRVIGSRR